MQAPLLALQRTAVRSSYRNHYDGRPGFAQAFLHPAELRRTFLQGARSFPCETRHFVRSECRRNGSQECIGLVVLREVRDPQGPADEWRHADEWLRIGHKSDGPVSRRREK